MEIAKLAVREFEQGTLRETIDDFEGRILLARSELERATDRVAWCLRMKAKGYLPAASGHARRSSTVARLDLSLAQQVSAFDLFKKYTAPRTSKVLKGAVTAAETTLEYQRMRLARQRDRLALLEQQVKNCTIRAPHDGFVIYANNSDRQIFIEPGVPVRQRQQLFFLPDLTDMEVVAMLHESIVDDVAPDARSRSRRGDRQSFDRGPRHVGRAHVDVQLAIGRHLLRGEGQARRRRARRSSRA